MDGLNLPEKLAGILEDFTNKLISAYGEGLVSVVLYGSASSGEFTEKYSNVNVIVVLNDTSLVNLSKAYPIVNSRLFRRVSPVFFTEEYITSSLDVFPIEFLDIKENHEILYGKDVVKGFNVDDKNLRFQCEHELKSKLINIKARYLAVKNKTDLENLLFKNLTSLLHIMRNLIRLKTGWSVYPRNDISTEFVKVFGVDTSAVKRALEAKNKGTALSYEDIDMLLSGFVIELEAITAIADKL